MALESNRDTAKPGSRVSAMDTREALRRKKTQSRSCLDCRAGPVRGRSGDTAAQRRTGRDICAVTRDKTDAC